MTKPKNAPAKNASTPQLTSSLPPSLKFNLRPHRDIAPGAPDKPRAKKTPAAAAAAREAKAKAQQENAEKRAAGIQRAAELEDRMQQNDREADQTANHPPPGRTTKATRPFIQPSNSGSLKEPVGAVREDHPRTAKVRGESTRVSLDKSEEFDDADGAVDPVSPGPGSSDNYQQGESEVEDQEDEILLDGSEEEEQPKKTTRKKSKVLVREVIVSQRLPTVPTTVVNKGQGKRKADQAERPPVPKKPKKKIGGLRDGWDEGPGLGFEPRHQRSSSSMSISSSASIPNTVYTTGSESTDAVGGVSDDDEEGVEMQAGSKSKSAIRYFGGGVNEKAPKVHSIAKIVPTTSVPELVGKRHAGDRLRKEDIKLSSLPTQIRLPFRTKFIPYLRDLAGTISPWEQPTEDQIISVWDKTIKDFPLHNDPDLKKMVFTLVEARLASWRNTFATTAHASLKKLFKNLGLDSTVKRQEYVTWVLGDSDRQRPFYYETYDVEDGKKPVGIFQSSLIIHTFASHLSSISSVPSADRQAKPQVGALVYSVQAVKRALLTWRTGEEVTLSRPRGDFSKSNWGDHQEIREGQTYQVRTTSNLVKLVDQLKTKQWEKIITKALAVASSTPSEDAAGQQVVDDVAEEMELIDGDEDLSGSESEDSFPGAPRSDSITLPAGFTLDSGMDDIQN